MWLSGEGSGIATAVTWVGALAQERPHAVSVAKKRKYIIDTYFFLDFGGVTFAYFKFNF